MTPDEAKDWILDALADLPSGPPGEEILAILMAAAWEEGRQAEEDAAPLTRAVPNPYRKSTQ